MPLETEIQRRACRVPERRMQGIAAVIQHLQDVPPGRNDHRLCIFVEND